MIRKSCWRLRYFRCPVCGTVSTAPKTDGWSHTGHIKTMWCWVCKAERDHVQIDADKAR